MRDLSKLFGVYALVAGLAYLAVLILIAGVAWHFISKVW